MVISVDPLMLELANSRHTSGPYLMMGIFLNDIKKCIFLVGGQIQHITVSAPSGNQVESEMAL